VIARGRDATDVAMLNSFGQHTLQRFEVITEEVEDSDAGDRRQCRPGAASRSHAMSP
jgi:molybdenum-dependent DNA-binding transcriptional regulator ModE